MPFWPLCYLAHPALDDLFGGTKAAVVAVSEGLRQEVAGLLRVAVVTPGMTDTSFEMIAEDCGMIPIVDRKATRCTAYSPARICLPSANAVGALTAINLGQVPWSGKYLLSRLG